MQHSCPVLHRHLCHSENLRVEHPPGRQVRDLHHGCSGFAYLTLLFLVEKETCCGEAGDCLCAFQRRRALVSGLSWLCRGHLTEASPSWGHGRQGVHRQRSQHPLGSS